MNFIKENKKLVALIGGGIIVIATILDLVYKGLFYQFITKFL